MKTMAKYLCGLALMALLGSLAAGQEKETGLLQVSGSLTIPQDLRPIPKGSVIVVAVRDADCFKLLASTPIPGPDTMATDTGVVRKPYSLPCYMDPLGCPYMLKMKLHHRGVRKCIVSLEIQDQLYRSTMGREGCNRILGYYCAPVGTKPALKRETDVKKATVLPLDPKKRLAPLKLDVH